MSFVRHPPVLNKKGGDRNERKVKLVCLFKDFYVNLKNHKLKMLEKMFLSNFLNISCRTRAKQGEVLYPMY